MTDLTALADRLDPRKRSAEGLDPCTADTDLLREAASALRSMGTVRAMQWQPIETAPKMKVLLLFAVSDVDRDGSVRNWKMATGSWHTGYADDEKWSPWEWDGRQLRPYDLQPTHWQPLPPPPGSPMTPAAREEMVEKLARIMWIDTSDKDYWDHVDDHTRNIYRSNAVAVLAVLMPEESRTIVEKE